MDIKKHAFWWLNSGGGASLQDITQISGFSAANYYGGAPGPQANTTGFTVWVAVMPSTSGNNQICFRRANTFPNTNGWALQATTGEFRFSIGNGSTVNSSSIGTSALEVGKVQVLHGVVLSGNIYFFKNGVQIGSPVALASYTSTASNMNLGGNSGAEYFRGGIIAAGICSSTGLTAAQVLAHYEAMVLDVYAQPTGATNLFKSIDAGATWVDSIGGISLNRNGTPTVSNAETDFFDMYNPDDYTSDSTALTPAISNVAGSMKILPVGDSRTLGTGGTDTDSYRNGVAVAFQADAEIDEMDFVGPSSSSAIDPQHDGQAGWTAGTHLIGGGAIPDFDEVLTTYGAKFYIVWIGTNSFASDANYTTGIANYLTLIRDIHSYDSDARIVVCDETPNTSSGFIRQRVYDYNYWLWNTAWPTLISEGVKLRRVKMFHLVVSGTSDYADGVHLSDTGYAKLVDPIFDGLKLAAGY